MHHLDKVLLSPKGWKFDKVFGMVKAMQVTMDELDQGPLFIWKRRAREREGLLKMTKGGVTYPNGRPRRIPA